MVTIIQRARVYIRRRERRKKGISLPVDTQASEGGVANGWRFGEFALLILLRVVLRLKILGGGARGGSVCLVTYTSHHNKNPNLDIHSCLGKGWEDGRCRMLHKQVA